MTPEQHKAAEEFKRLRGVEPFGPFIDLLASPELMTRVGALGEYLRYRSALTPLGVAMPAANAKVEGALLSPTPVGSAGASLTLGPDGFFDATLFDPDKLDAYIAGQKR